MAFCGNCGNKVEDNVKFCPSCGNVMNTTATPAEPVQPPVEPQPQQVYEQPVQPEPTAEEKLQQATTAVDNFAQKLGNTADSTAQFSKEDIEQNKVMSVLAYFGFLVIVPIVAAKNSPFARFHSNQGLVLFLGMIAWIIAGLPFEDLNSFENSFNIGYKLKAHMLQMGFLKLLLFLLFYHSL